MKLNSVQWSDAQKLLLQLVDALSPYAEKPSPPYFSPSLRLYIPLKNEINQSLQIRNPVRILLTLQKQVHDWAGVEQGEGTVSYKGSHVEKNTITPQSPNAPIAEEAKSLITKVQVAIGTLISSTNIKDPKEEPLREAMKRLKPDLDKMIHRLAIAEEGEESLQKPATRSFVSRSEREMRLMRDVEKEVLKPQIGQEILKQLTPENAKISEEKIPLDTTLVKEAKLPELSVQKSEGNVATANFQRLKVETQKEELLTPSEKKTVNFLRPSKPSPIVQGGFQIQINDQEQVVSRPIEKPSIPLVPFVAETRSLTPARKKKKKKGFWRRGDEDNDRKDS